MSTQLDLVTGQTPPGEKPMWWGRRAMGLIWLVGLIVPITNLLGQHPAPLRLALSFVGVALFIVLFSRIILNGLFTRLLIGTARRGGMVSVLVLAALSCGLIIWDGSAWLDMLVYTTVFTGMVLQERQAIRVVALVTVAAFAFTRLYALDWNNTLGLVLVTLGGGFVTVGYGRLITTVNELRAAREEVARLAVAEERLRIARDLHDLLGHSLSLIALKSELAARLSLVAPERAAAEIEDVEGVARKALQEMREAVAAYRQPTLASELSGANELLSAAGIGYTYLGMEVSSIRMLPAAEAALAWAVREGVTNVIRHSRAQHCVIRLSREDNRVCLEVRDDGHGTGEMARRGNGLAGLKERVAALGGQCEAGHYYEENGGFRLAVTLPLDARAEALEDTVTQAGEKMMAKVVGA
jgi:two-component system sensor histidine kinase DesK